MIWLWLIGALAASFVVAIVAYQYAKNKFHCPEETVQAGLNLQRAGWYLPPYFTQFIIRPIFGIIGGLAITIPVLLLLRLVLQNTTLEENPLILLGGTLALAVAVAWSDDPQGARNIPNGHVGILTWLDNRWNVYLTEGTHTWLPTFLGFNINTQALYGTQNKADSPRGPEQGFVFVTPDTLDIWNDGTKVDGKINRVLESITRNGSSVFTSFTIFFIVTDPKKYSSIQDPILRIADQTRAGLRKAIALFHDDDVTSLKSTIAAITKGQRVLIAFSTEDCGGYPEGSVVRTNGGVLLVSEVADGDDVTKAREELQGRIEAEAHSRFKGKTVISEISIAEKIEPTVAACGAHFIGSVIANVTLPKIKADTAQEASALPQRREITRQLAEMQIQVMEKMKQTGVSETVRILAALNSGTENIQLVHNSGDGNPLTQAAATIATNLGGGNQKGGAQ